MVMSICSHSISLQKKKKSTQCHLKLRDKVWNLHLITSNISIFAELLFVSQKENGHFFQISKWNEQIFFLHALVIEKKKKISLRLSDLRTSICYICW